MVNFFDFKIYNGDFNEIFSDGFNTHSSKIIATINPHSFIISRSDLLFKTALQNADYLMADGVGIKLSLAFRLKNVKLYNGLVLHKGVIDYLNKKALRVFYMGSSDKVLIKILNKHKIETPNWIIKTYSPPYKPIFNSKENSEILKQINSFEPDILFVGLTAPKQEKWVEQNKTKIKACYIFSIGAVFDFYSGEKNFAPIFFQKIHLIWLYRLFVDFKHVWKRTFISMPLFIYFNVKSMFTKC